MSTTPFMKLWVSDFLGDTLELDATEIGAYMLLLMAQWNRDEKSLPADDKKMQRIARCGRGWSRVWGNIGHYFDKDEDGIFNKRLRLEATIVAAKVQVNKRNGSFGGVAKSLKTKKPDVANATISPKRIDGQSEPEPEPDKEVDKSTSSQEAGGIRKTYIVPRPVKIGGIARWPKSDNHCSD